VNGKATQRSSRSFLVSLDPSAQLSLQQQIRRQILAAIASGAFPPGWRLPSSRQLARELAVARNTVSLAYQEMLAEGHLESRERSGIFVAQLGRAARLERDPVVGGKETNRVAPQMLSGRVRQVASLPHGFRLPPDWQRYRFPFIDACFDHSLFPVAEWREASRLALGAAEIAQRTNATGSVDDELLIEQIRARILPRRGIIAARNEILIVGSEQQALFLIAKANMDGNSRVAIEEPGLPQTRAVLELAGVQIHHQRVDDSGLVVDEHLGACDFIHVTPSRQRPTGVTMPHERRVALLELAQRQDLLIIEDDFDSETTVLGRPLTALRGMAGGERVLYVASLSRALAPAIQISFLCGPAEIIAAARQVRDLATHSPSPTTQRAAAHFLALGHHDALGARVLRIVQERLLALRDAINHYMPQSLAEPLPQSVAIAPTAGGSSVWVRGPAGLDARRLAVEVERRGVLIEPASGYFSGDDPPLNMFRLGVGGIPADRYREGVATIAEVMKELAGPATGPRKRRPLRGDAIAERLRGATLLYRTVYGEPCTMVLGPDGTLEGRAGFASEEVDSGRWWVEGDLWFRQWREWAYGEASGYRIAIRGDQLFWLDADGHQVDSAVIAARHSEPPAPASTDH